MYFIYILENKKYLLLRWFIKSNLFKKKHLVVREKQGRFLLGFQNFPVGYTRLRPPVRIPLPFGFLRLFRHPMVEYIIEATQTC